MRQALDFKKRHSWLREIIVVNDGSTDNTLQLLNRFKPGIRIISYEENRGKGYAIKRGILVAIGLVQLEKVDKMNEMRRSNAMFLNKALAGLHGLELPVEKRKCRHVYQMYTVKLDKELDRTKFSFP